jgi:hypothetical protein
MVMDRKAELVRVLREGVLAQGEAMRRGDATTGNKHAKRYIAAFQALRAMGDEGRDALVPLMFEGPKDVRSMAAAFLLRHRHQDARRVLEEISRGEGMVSFGAGECLKRWEEGVWALDPEESPHESVQTSPNGELGTVEGMLSNDLVEHSDQHDLGPFGFVWNATAEENGPGGQQIRICDIPLKDVKVGKVWKVTDDRDPDMLRWSIEPLRALPREEENVVYSVIGVHPSGMVMPELLIREVGTYDWWGDSLQYVDGAWREIEFVGEDGPWSKAEYYVGSPLPNDPSFSGGDSHEVHRTAFARWRDRLPE